MEATFRSINYSHTHLKKVNPYVSIAILAKITYVSVYYILVNFTTVSSALDANCRYDCYWYAEIANRGYTPKSEVSLAPNGANWGFFPLFPYLVKILHLSTPIDIRLVGFVVNTLLFIVGVFFLGKFIEEKYGNRISKFTIALFCFSPVSVYLNSFYTEAAFFSLIAALTWFIYTDRPFLIVFIASLLGVTRNTGALIATLLIFSWQLQKKCNLLHLFRAGLFSLVSVLLLGVHILVLSKTTGDYFAIVSHHRVHRGNPISWILSSLSFQSPLQIGLLILFIFTIYVFGKNLREKNYCEAAVLFPVLLTSISYPTFINWRYFLILFPLYLYASRRLIQINSRILTAAIICLEIAFLVFAQFSWIMNYGFMV